MSSARKPASSQRQHLLQHRRQADRAIHQPARAGKDEQVADDLRRPVRLTINRLDFPLQLLGKRARSRAAARGGQGRPGADCSARARCPPRTARAPPASLTGSAACAVPRARPASFDCGVRSRATSTRPAVWRSWSRRSVTVTMNGPFSIESTTSSVLRGWIARSRRRRQPGGQLGSDAVGQRPVEQLVARDAEALRQTPGSRGR